MFNIAAKARPYFGAVVLTAALLTVGGIYSATRMPSGVYPEVTAPLIRGVPDVYRADVAGGDLREIEVEARPDDLFHHGLCAADLADQIGKVHRLMPIGRVEGKPYAYQLMLNTQVEKAKDIEDLV